MRNPDIVNIFVKLINLSPKAHLMDTTFDELNTLFQTDTEAAERKVHEIIESYISTLPAERQERARAYNWRLQQELRKYKDPVARMNKMVELFWAGVQKFHVALTDPKTILDQRGDPSVISFPKKK